MMDEVIREIRENRGPSDVLEASSEAGGEEKLKPLALVHMQGPMFLYLICVVCTLAAFVTEVVGCASVPRHPPS